MQLRERIGTVIGTLLSPVVAAVSNLRRARTFHPRGLVFQGRSEPIIGGAFANLGAELEGTVLARCSGALWKQPNERFDVLGIALRFRQFDRPFDHRALPLDRDLLFATVSSPLLLAASPFLTNAHDFLANKFYATCPFEVHGHDRVEIRLVPLQRSEADGSRADKLRHAVEHGCAWHLEARKTLTRDWHPIARIVFERELELDQEALHFDPFRTGEGLAPVGLVHAIRKAVYSASQHARPAHD